MYLNVAARHPMRNTMGGVDGNGHANSATWNGVNVCEVPDSASQADVEGERENPASLPQTARVGHGIILFLTVSTVSCISARSSADV